MGKKYTNLTPMATFGDYTDPFGQRRGTGPVRSERPLDAAEPELRKDFGDSLVFAWLGHSSVFLSIQGTRLLIDPVFCRYASPLPFAGPKRFPGRVLTPDDLPPLDAVLITHNHYDHLDRQAVRALNAQVQRFIVPMGVGALLRRFGIEAEKITELSWHESCQAGNVTVFCTPSQHGSARSLSDRNETLWGSFLLKSPDYTVFDTGDGGFGSHFADIQARYGDVDLAIMECGQYNRRWHSFHMFPEESAQAAKQLGAGLAIPVHWGAYVLSDHPWDDPPKRFSRRAEELGVPCHVPKLYEVIPVPRRSAQK